MGSLCPNSYGANEFFDAQNRVLQFDVSTGPTAEASDKHCVSVYADGNLSTNSAASCCR